MRKILCLYFLMMFVIGTDTFLISPLLPTLGNEFRISVGASGWMIGAYALGYALFALIAGPLSDGWNRKKIMIYGMLGFSFSTFLCGTAHGFWSMCAFRTLAGISAAFTSPQVWATIPVLVPPRKIVKYMGIATAGLAVSQTLGVPIGSYLAFQSWKFPFFAIGSCSILLSLVIIWIVPDMMPVTTGKQPSIARRYMELLHGGMAQKSFLGYFAFQTGNFAAFTYIGIWLTDKFQMNVTQIGGVLFFLGLGNIIGSFFGSRGVAMLGRQVVLPSGIALMAFLYLTLNFTASPMMVKTVFFLIFMVAGTIFPVMMSLLQTLSATARGTIASLSNAVMYAATTIGAYVAGFLYAHVNGFLAVTIFTAMSYLLSIFLWMRSGVTRVEKRPEAKVSAINGDTHHASMEH